MVAVTAVVIPVWLKIAHQKEEVLSGHKDSKVLCQRR
jgi:hypothetical protein